MCRRAEPQHREYRSPKSDASHHAEVHGEVNWRTPGRERTGRKRMTMRRIERGRGGVSMVRDETPLACNLRLSVERALPSARSCGGAGVRGGGGGGGRRRQCAIDSARTLTKRYPSLRALARAICAPSKCCSQASSSPASSDQDFNPMQGSTEGTPQGRQAETGRLPLIIPLPGNTTRCKGPGAGTARCPKL